MHRPGPNQSMTRVTYGWRSRGVQLFQSASVIIPDSLQATFSWSARGIMACSHARSLGPAAIPGLAMWSSTKRIVAHHLDGGRKLTGSDQEVVDQTCIADGANPAPHVGAQEPKRIRLVVDLVADAHQPAAARAGAQRL